MQDDGKNQTVRDILNKQAVLGRLAHAYLFLGPNGAGKKDLALEFASKVLEIDEAEEAKLSRHPDFLHLDCGAGVGAEVVRDFIGKMALRPFVAERKFALLSNIENLNIQGANALLKTLEEPPENTVMVLTAATRKVLPTIFSRCMTFNFNPLSLKLRGTSRKNEADSLIVDFFGQTLAERLLSINRLAELEDWELKEAMEFFIYHSAFNLAAEPEKYPVLAAGLKAYESLETNKNRKFILQGLMLSV